MSHLKRHFKLRLRSSKSLKCRYYPRTVKPVYNEQHWDPKGDRCGKVAVVQTLKDIYAIEVQNESLKF
jgi:hypothetical protein